MAVSGLNQTSLTNLQSAHVPDPVIALADNITANMHAGGKYAQADLSVTIPNLPDGRAIATAANQASPSVINGTMDSTYPSLTSRHVYLLRALGIPEVSLQTLAGYNPTAVEVEQYLQAFIANPDQTDVDMGRDVGTTKKLLAQIPADILANPNPDAYPTPEVPTAPVDHMDQQYATIPSEQVEILRAVGFPEEFIAEYASTSPNPAETQATINEYIADPEAVDNMLGHAPGTARAGLTQLGITPGGAPAGKHNWMKWGLIAAGVAAAAFVGWKFMHRNPAEAIAQGGPGGAVDGTMTVLGGRMGSDGPYAVNLLGLAQAGIDPGAYVSGLMGESKNTALVNGLKELGFAAKATLGAG
jgi:hypothetical protein